MRLLLEANNRDILSGLRLELLARRILARGIKQTELKEHPMEGIFSFDFENLGLLPSQWIKLFEARGQTGTPCIIPEQEADIFRSNDAFRETIQIPTPTMILVPMMIEENPNAIIQAITDTNHIAEKQARGCL
jgi:hypothetical protein